MRYNTWWFWVLDVGAIYSTDHPGESRHSVEVKLGLFYFLRCFREDNIVLTDIGYSLADSVYDSICRWCAKAPQIRHSQLEAPCCVIPQGTQQLIYRRYTVIPENREIVLKSIK